ncbi:hypothetical protein MG293_006650 [Ovis ammon polii]|uniref:Uncharacterized protein n=1 Tax=Ovis ammon polii TaxID=230172 RepID=A0AAD4UEV8_OVIAM|nr:hypothetical protein MG293_006650 [Ovis ammon polii]
MPFLDSCYTDSDIEVSRFHLDQLLVDQHCQLTEGCESASRPINPSPYSHDEFTSAVRYFNVQNERLMAKLLMSFSLKSVLIKRK